MAEGLDDLMDRLREFQELDQFMSVTTALAFLEIVKAGEDNEIISTRDLELRLNVDTGTASRVGSYWGKGNKVMTKAHDFVHTDFHPTDRRKRAYTLTPKGKMFLKKLMGQS